ncbi:MAG: aminotransferase class I/II-fold pyridoxal phosphate-dependent enzyme, partial [bacterium]|nr:aminotransferase class I/II-fold pyridoxal phosphate-dependent enzyme [bacterium]
ICNPNNPTGTHTPADDLERLVEAVPDRVTIVFDEAYFEYADAPDYASAIPLASSRDNVIVARTFSKVYGLAGMRVGYAVGRPELISSLRRPQPPFAITALAQVAAIEALRHQDLVAARVKDNAAGRQFLTQALRDLGESVIDSQTNFILWEPRLDPTETAAALLADGVMVR